jgi:hypothetical protein
VRNSLDLTRRDLQEVQVTTNNHSVDLSTKATIAAVRECVTRRHYEQAVAALGTELEKKVSHSAIASLQATLQVRSNCFFFLP